MRHRFLPYAMISLFLVLALTSCSVAQSFMPSATPTSIPTSTQTPLPPTATPTPTEVPFYVKATVFSGEMQVPILIYHWFIPDWMGETTSMKTQLSVFKEELQTLYDAGFSLISLKSWLDGSFIVPEGRKPLIITIDDGWAANQLFVDENGQPSEYSGLGVLYRFYQEHPDFGYHAAVSAIYGDKYYAEKQVGDQFFVVDNAAWNTPSWRIKLGNTIAWALENGIEAYNHTLNHPDLTALDDKKIQFELIRNDEILRTFLTEAGRQDLIPSLDNMIALPEGKWPASQSGKNVVLNYKNQEGKPVIGVMEAYNMDAAKFMPSFYSEGFNPYAVVRITASPYFVNFIVENKDLAPTAQICDLGPLKEEQAENQDVLENLIVDAVSSQRCAEGVYHVSGYIFFVNNGEITLHSAPAGEAVPDDAGSTPTP